MAVVGVIYKSAGDLDEVTRITNNFKETDLVKVILTNQIPKEGVNKISSISSDLKSVFKARPKTLTQKEL